MIDHQTDQKVDTIAHYIVYLVILVGMAALGIEIAGRI